MSGKRIAETAKKRRWPAVIAAAAALLCAAGAGFGWYAHTYDRVFPGVTAADARVELGGLSRQEAAQLLQAEIPALLEGSVHQVELEGEVIASYTAAQVGYAPDLELMGEKVWAVGRDGNILTNAVAFAKGLLGMGTDVSLYLDWDEEKADAVMDELAALVEQPAVDSSYELTRDGLFATREQDGITLDREQLRTMFATWEPGTTQRLECPVTEQAGKALDMEALASQLNAEAAPARYDAQLGKVVEGQVGVALDAESAVNALESAAPGQRVQLPAQVIYPEYTAAELEAALFRDVLGTCTTSVSGSGARRGNVKLAGESVNGTILNSGDIFDYNKIVGERTAERGYGAAASYINGETVDTIGGGICQVSSTVYKAALLSNLEITERYAHRFYPGYITLGMDATVSWGGPEFRFKNNTDFPVRIDVTYENSKLTVTFMGTKTDDTYVEMTRKVLSTTGFETEYVETEELAWGTEKEKQNGYTGYVVETYRNVYAGDGTLISSKLEAKSNYKNRNQIIAVGIAGRPEGQQPPAAGEIAPPTQEDSAPPAQEDSGDMPSWLA